MSRCIAVLNKAKHALDHKSLRTLYCTLVLPYLIYCVEVWGNNYMTTIHPLLILQKKAIRIIHGAGYRDHTNSLFLQSKLIKFKDMVDFHTAQILFKAKNNLLPENIQTLFTAREGGYDLRGKFKFKVRVVPLTQESSLLPVVLPESSSTIPLDASTATLDNIL